MYFNAFFTSLLLAATFTFSTNADTIVAFSSTLCDGSVGDTVQCDSSCHQFTGRHSLMIGGVDGSNAHCVTYFVNSNCAFVEGEGGTDIFGPGVCQHVLTGGPVNSFMCSPTTVCDCEF
ncbi:hypothetical protein BJ912DRAFT_970170 [Pholiota molesta]|nr:hypothetical protein BJ912DRAFT_970170 [Pholiota molesta]